MFAYIASHDLRAPLRNISGFAHLAERQLAQGSQEGLTEYMSFIQGNAKKMHQLIEEIMQFSTIDQQIVQVAPRESVNLGVLIRNIINHLGDCNLTTPNTIFHFDLDQVWLVTIPHALQVVLQHLMINGLKYNESATPCVRITYAEDDDFHQIEVANNGIGIAEEFQEQIFVLFKRLHTDAQYQGTGMGLAIAQKIVHRLDGEIQLSSIVGEGSVFRVRLPK